jgi:hypothetical protein
MLDRQCPRVVETREPATETTLEDVLARNLSIRSTAHARTAGFTTPGCQCAWHVLVLCLEGVARLLSTFASVLLPEYRPPFRRHACAAPVLVRPLAQARYVEGAPRLAALSAPPKEKQLLLSTTRST